MIYEVISSEFKCLQVISNDFKWFQLSAISYQLSIDVYGYPWIPTDIHGYLELDSSAKPSPTARLRFIRLQQLKGNPPGTARHEAEPLGPLHRHQGLEGQGLFLLLGK